MLGVLIGLCCVAFLLFTAPGRAMLALVFALLFGVVLPIAVIGGVALFALAAFS